MTVAVRNDYYDLEYICLKTVFEKQEKLLKTFMIFV